MTDGSRSETHPLNVCTTTSNLWEHLWRKKTKGRGSVGARFGGVRANRSAQNPVVSTCPLFSIPDTIVFTPGKAPRWFFSSRSRETPILKKKLGAAGIYSAVDIFEAFSRPHASGSVGCNISCILTHCREDGSSEREFLRRDDLFRWLSRHVGNARSPRASRGRKIEEAIDASEAVESLKGPTILQRFVTPRNKEVDTVRCRWTGQSCFIHRRRNIYAYDQEGIDINRRCSTYSGNLSLLECSHELPVRNHRLASLVLAASRWVVDHILECSTAYNECHGLTLDFRRDGRGRLWLLGGENFQETQKPSFHLRNDCQSSAENHVESMEMMPDPEAAATTAAMLPVESAQDRFENFRQKLEESQVPLIGGSPKSAATQRKPALNPKSPKGAAGLENASRRSVSPSVPARPPISPPGKELDVVAGINNFACPAPDCVSGGNATTISRASFRSIAHHYSRQAQASKTVPALLAAYIPAQSWRRYQLLLKNVDFCNREIYVCAKCAEAFRRRDRQEGLIADTVAKVHMKRYGEGIRMEMARRKTRGPTVPLRRFDRFAKPKHLSDGALARLRVEYQERDRAKKRLAERRMARKKSVERKKEEKSAKSSGNNKRVLVRGSSQPSIPRSRDVKEFGAKGHARISSKDEAMNTHKADKIGHEVSDVAMENKLSKANRPRSAPPRRGALRFSKTATKLREIGAAYSISASAQQHKGRRRRRRPLSASQSQYRMAVKTITEKTGRRKSKKMLKKSKTIDGKTTISKLRSQHFSLSEKEKLEARTDMLEARMCEKSNSLSLSKQARLLEHAFKS